MTGTGASEIQHIIVKPKDVGLKTSLVVTTDRRTYHMTLKSHSTQYYPRVAFVYPDAMLAKWSNFRAKEDAAIQRNTLPSGEYLGNLDFEYKVEGKATWKPLRVFNDGRKTVLQMPAEIKQQEAPTLLVVRKDGGVFKDAETVMVNYRIQGDRYVVDSVFDKAILIIGVGGSQDKVTITRKQ